MKYLDRVITENADGENIEKGYRVELSDLDVLYIQSALTFADEMSSKDNPLWEEHSKLLEQIERLYEVAGKGLRSIDLS